jgi:hypothetical protein
MSKVFTLPNEPIAHIAAPNDFSSDYNLGPFAKETAQRFIFGTRYLTWDGRVFKYGHAAAECQSGYGAYNLAVVNISANCPLAAAIGDRRLNVTCTSGGYAADGAIAKDELAGASIVIGNSQEDPVNMTIVGNDAAVSNTVWVDLEWPLPIVVPASAVGYTEIMLNPFAHLSGGATAASGAKASVMGIPKVNLAATYNGWIQTWGATWITPPSPGATAPGYTDNDREVYFVANGTIVGAASGTVIESGFQRAGYIIHADTAGNNAGPPILMLQLSI